MEENVTECNSAKNQEPTGRREALNYLEGLHKNYAAYHGQKETLGWAGIALFATLVPVLFTQLPNTESITHKLLATITILVLTISVLRYINTQTRLRHKAADFVAASLALQTEIVSGSMETIDFLQVTMKTTSTSQHMFYQTYF
ncbi:MAG: hypothetical protein FWC99_04850 [Coriobacteriia bacterium]|nr:hypothetical protein [Coriobacteriia bacterium]